MGAMSCLYGSDIEHQVTEPGYAMSPPVHVPRSGRNPNGRLVSRANSCYFISYFHYYRIMEEKDVIKSLAALAQSHRLQAFRALVVAGQQGMTPGVLAEELDVPAATLSFHLKELVHAGLISQERSGRNLIYRADFVRMDALLAFLTDNCCQGEVCLDEAASRCNC